MAEAGRQEKRARVRKQNFSPEEVKTLYEEYRIHRQILTACRTSKATNKEKERIWRAILARVRAIGVADRTVEELKAKISNLKAATVRSKDQHSTTVTGGGPPAGPPLPNEDLSTDPFGKDSVGVRGIPVSGTETPLYPSTPTTHSQTVIIDGDEIESAVVDTDTNGVGLPANNGRPVTTQGILDLSFPENGSHSQKPKQASDATQNEVQAAVPFSEASKDVEVTKEQPESRARRNLKRKRKPEFNEDEVMTKYFHTSTKLKEVAIAKMEKELDTMDVEKEIKEKEVKKLDLEIALLQIQLQKARKENE